MMAMPTFVVVVVVICTHTLLSITTKFNVANFVDALPPPSKRCCVAYKVNFDQNLMIFMTAGPKFNFIFVYYYFYIK